MDIMENVDCFYQHIVLGKIDKGKRYRGEKEATWLLHCHLQIFSLNSKQQVVLISDMGCEISWLIPDHLELLASHIVKDFYLDTERLIWIQYNPPWREMSECHAAKEFSQMIFQWQDGKASNLKWFDLSEEMHNTLKTNILKLESKPVLASISSPHLNINNHALISLPTQFQFYWQLRLGQQ
jgi:hypothetical protein